MDLLDGEVELTEFEAIDVKSIKGVKQGANGFPILMLKGLAAPAVKADAEAGPTHGAFNGTHTHPHAANGAQGSDDTHEHSHSHDGDGDHGHTHSSQKSAADIVSAAVAKAVVDGQIDEGPDVDLGRQIMGLLARAIQAEAAEIEAGSYGETCDVRTLVQAADMVAAWTNREQGGCGCCAACTGPGCGCCPGCYGDMVMDSVAGDSEACSCGCLTKADMSTKDINDLPDSAFAYIEDGGSKDSAGKTTPRSKRHFPVHDAAHTRNALSRAPQSPFGDKAMPKIKAAAKKFGIGDDDASKAAVAADGSAVDTDAQGTDSQLAKAIEDAVTKATKALQERVETLSADLAKVKAAPVPGGPVLSHNVQAKGPRAGVDEGLAAKAALYRQKAEDATSPGDRAGYLALARETEQAAQKSPAD